MLEERPHTRSRVIERYGPKNAERACVETIASENPRHNSLGNGIVATHTLVAPGIDALAVDA